MNCSNGRLKSELSYPVQIKDKRGLYILAISKTKESVVWDDNCFVLALLLSVFVICDIDRVGVVRIGLFVVYFLSL